MRTIRVGPTAPLRDALTAFRDTWPGLALGIFDGGTASYKEGTEAYRLHPDGPILATAGLAAHDPDPAARPLPPLDPA